MSEHVTTVEGRNVAATTPPRPLPLNIPRLCSVFVRRFVRNAQDYGWCVAIWKSAAYLSRPVYARRTYRLYRIRTRSFPELSTRANDVDFRILGETDYQTVEQIEHFAEWYRGKLQQRLAAGDLCLAAFHGDKLVGFNLVALRDVYVPLLNRTRRLRRTTAWSDHIAVHKDYRRKGVASQLRLRVLSELRKRGIRTLCGGTLSTNSASLNLARKLGFEECVDVTYVQIFTRKCWQCKRVRSHPRGK